jgi:sugar lactone lactonase YvrE
MITEYKMPILPLAILTPQFSTTRGTSGSPAAKQHGGSSVWQPQVAGTMPTPKSRPYGIKLSADDIPWVACNGSNCLVKIDPETMATRQYALPDAKTTVRRLAFGSDGMIWYVNSSLGRLGRLDPKTAQIKEWPSPSGPKSHPYAIAVADGIVWYNEFGAEARYARPIRPCDGAIPELGDSLWRHLRRHREAHEADAGRQPADSPEQHKPDYLGDT